jgi:heme oxygenase (biliverdin-IX-beta and delta-forming)
MFSDELKSCTMHVHAGLEKKLVSKIRKVKTVSDYIALLRVMYGYYKPFQERIQPGISQNITVRYADDILNDIRDLGSAEHQQIPVCEHIPPLNTPASVLGALYVTEGSTLGGQIITKMIAKQLNISCEKGFTFFNAYGDDTHVMWEKFKHVLNHPRPHNEQTEMKNAAIETFSTFNAWITENERN